MEALVELGWNDPIQSRFNNLSTTIVTLTY